MTELAEGVNCQWRIAARPVGNVKREDFEYRETEIPEPGEGEFLLRTLYLGLAPVMRMYMLGEAVAQARPLEIGDIIHGRGVAEVVASKHPDYQVGDVVQGQLGWQTYKISRGTPGERFFKMPVNDMPLGHAGGTLGMTGLSAWGGWMQCADARPGDRVLVSGAAGGVGTLVVQMARIQGCHVTAMAGGPEKCRFLEELGCDRTIDYKSEDLAGRLPELFPDGIDVYFDNVGGDTLSACLDNLAMGARIVLCGSISEYLLDEPYGLMNYTRLRSVNGTMRGFFVYNFWDRFDECVEQLAGWIRAGQLRPVEQVIEGFHRMPEALARLYDGVNVGVQICQVRADLLHGETK
ncbi:MAG: NADP-dependent oxidoreductase [Xanthomonadales bacterium]|nr:NADP-dependent oxidoreductase [Xanthomonadales bacterium]